MQIDRKFIEDEFDKFFEFDTNDKSIVLSVSCRLFAEHISRLAATPVQPLTDEQIMEQQEKYVGGPSPSYPLGASDWIEFARAIERAHGIGTPQ